MFDTDEIFSVTDETLFNRENPEAQAKLTDLIHRLAPGDEVLITDNDQPVARLVSTAATPPKRPRQLETLKETVLFHGPRLRRSTGNGFSRLNRISRSMRGTRSVLGTAQK